MSAEPRVDLELLWDFDHPAASERAFRDHLPDARPDPTTSAELLTQIARAQGLQGHFEAGHRTLSEATQHLAGAAARAHVRYFLERGRLFHAAGDREQARPAFVDAWELALQHRETALAIDAAHMLGIVAPLDEQYMWTQRALELAEAADEPLARRWRGPLYNNLGWTCYDTQRYEEALDLFRRDARFRHTSGQIRESRRARWAIGRCLRALERYDEARMVQEALLAELEGAGLEDGFVHEELGEILLATGQPEAARPHLGSAYLLLSQDEWLAAHEPARLARLKALSHDTNTGG